jgi:hypothetical protein
MDIHNNPPVLMDSYFYNIEIKPEGYGVDADIVSAFASQHSVKDVIIGKFRGSRFIFKSGKVKGIQNLPAEIVNNGLNFIKLDGRHKIIRATTGQTNIDATGAVKSKRRMRRRTKRIKTKGKRRKHYY